MAPPKRRGLGRGLGALIPTDVSDLTRESAAAPLQAGVSVAVVEPAETVEPAESAEAAPAAVPPQQNVSRETAPVGEPPAVDASGAPEPVGTTVGEGERFDAFAEPEHPSLSPVPGAKFRVVPVDEILVNPKQPREVFDEDALEELKTSIREVGLLQPIVVRPYELETEDGSLQRFELIMGERRLRASRAIGLDVIPAIVRETRDEDMLRDALLENIHRAQLNPLEEGAAYQQLLEEFGVTQEELSKRIGRSRPQISNTIRLMNLPVGVQRKLASGVLTAGHARALLSLPEPDQQEALAGRIIAEGLSVRTTEELVKFSDVSRETPSENRRKPKPHAPGVETLVERLSDHFDTRVKINIGQRKGRITIEFATVADLERIVGMMNIDTSSEEEE